MGANIQPSRIKAGLMTLTGTTSDGSTDVLKIVNHTGNTLGSINTQGIFTINNIITDLISGSTGGSFSLVGGIDPKLSLGLSTGNARLDILSTGSTKGFRLVDGTQGLGKVLTSDADGYGTWDTTSSEITGATNLGSGDGQIYSGLTNNTLQFKTLSGGTSITLSTNEDYIIINSEVSAEDVDVVPVSPYTGTNLQLLSNEYGKALLYEYTITGNSTSTGFTITHGKNNYYVGVEILRNTSPYSTIYTQVSRPTANTVCITFDDPPANGLEYKVLITGRCIG